MSFFRVFIFLFTVLNVPLYPKRLTPLLSTFFPALPSVIRAFCRIFFCLTLSTLVVAQERIPTQLTFHIADQQNWYAVSDTPADTITLPVLQTLLQQAAEPVDTLIARQGAYVSRTSLSFASEAGNSWYLILNANFLDVGVGYWLARGKAPVKLDDFAQLHDQATPGLLHYQAVRLPVDAGEQGELLLYVQAQQFAYPLSLEVADQAHFFRKQQLINGITIATIAIMFTLAIMSLILYVRSGYLLALACAGYIGLHAFGWAAASGLLNDFGYFPEINTGYWGMYLFPWAIACAAQFARLLFYADMNSPRISRLLNLYTLLAAIIGILVPWLAFYQSFLVAHLLAGIWVPISVFVGLHMLQSADFRARYYLFGNALYAAALVFYIVSHAGWLNGGIYPELIVVSALAADCVCIILSMAEWLRKKQRAYHRSYYQARIDPLTGIGNRHAFNEALQTLHDDYALLFIDLDGMKAVNDSLGHDRGDQLLVDTAAVLQQLTGSAGHLFRTGGDEFIWLIDHFQQRYRQGGLSDSVDAETPAGGAEQAEHIIVRAEQALHAQGWPQVGISFGIASSVEVDSVSHCLSLADQRMYRLKGEKRARRQGSVI